MILSLPQAQIFFCWSIFLKVAKSIWPSLSLSLSRPALKNIYWLLPPFLFPCLPPTLLPFDFLHQNTIREAQVRQETWGRQAQADVKVHTQKTEVRGPESDYIEGD